MTIPRGTLEQYLHEFTKDARVQNRARPHTFRGRASHIRRSRSTKGVGVNQGKVVTRLQKLALQRLRAGIPLLCRNRESDVMLGEPGCLGLYSSSLRA